MSVCNDRQFIHSIDASILAYLQANEPTEELFCTFHNLRLLAHRIARRGGFPDDTTIHLDFSWEEDDPDQGLVTFKLGRKRGRKKALFQLKLDDVVYENPLAFDTLIAQMQRAAIALRERQIPCN
jgi:hypothetical protein